MYTEILKEENVEQTKDFTLSILTYEVGNLHRLKVYTERFGKDRTLYLGDQKIELADALTQISLLVEQYGYDLEELRSIGLDRFKTRIREVKKAELKGKYGD